MKRPTSKPLVLLICQNQVCWQLFRLSLSYDRESRIEKTEQAKFEMKKEEK